MAWLLCVAVLHAEDEFLVQSWQTDDGLPHSSVTSIAQTPDGYLWIGTYNGLARFDGVRFVVFDPGNTPALSNARVAWLGVDATGVLWVSMEDGSLAVREAESFRAVPVEGGGAILGRMLVTAGTDEVLLLTRQGRLWRRDTSKAGRLVPVSPPSPVIKDVARDLEGRVWCLHGSGKVGRWITNRLEDPLEPAELKGHKIHSLQADVQGRIWIGTERELAKFEGGQFRDATPTNTDGGPELTFTGMSLSGEGAWLVANGRLRRCVSGQWVADAGVWTKKFDPPAAKIEERVDRRGAIWFSHYGSGVLHVNTNGQERWLKARDGLPGERASCSFEDREGNIWVGLNRAGLVRLRERRFRVLGLEEGLRERVAMSVCEDREGAIWIGTFGGGLHRWVNGRMEAFDVGMRQPNIVVSVFPGKAGKYWLGTGGDGVLVWENGQITKPPFGLGQPTAGHAILEDSRGRVWIGNSSALFLWADGKLRRFGAGDGFRAPSARVFAEDTAGAVWIGASDGAIYRYAADQRFTEFRPDDALGRQPVWSLLSEPDGTIWAGTFRGGLLRLKNGRFTRCTTRDGLANDVICHILDDSAGHLWMGSHGGILRASKAALHAFCDGAQKSVASVAYGKSDGLPTVECSGNYQPAGWKGNDGRLWFATVKGAVSVQPRDVVVNPLPPSVVIEEILVDGKSEAQRPLQAQIGPGRHYVEFRYAGLSLAAPDKVRFKHRLEGLEQGWVEDSARREAKYSYIPPGNYRFHVLACNNDGVWNETGAVLALTVLPLFWQAGWFGVVVALCCALAIGVSVRHFSRRKLKLRLAALEQQHAIEKERSRIARDIHDDLGASLTQVALLGEMAERGATEPGEVRVRSRRISAAAREMARTLEAIVWAVRPENDTLPSLVGYLDRRADELLDSAPLRYRFEAPRNLPEHVVSAEVRHNVFLAFKEALTNALKHSGATELHIAVTMENGLLQLVIEDNGHGFEPTSVRKDGTGVANMRRRMKDIGGEFDLQSGSGKGTTVRLQVQLDGLPARPG